MDTLEVDGGSPLSVKSPSIAQRNSAAWPVKNCLGLWWVLFTAQRLVKTSDKVTQHQNGLHLPA